MSKRRRDERGGDRTAERRPQHLYLVFDDWSRGYSIRKLLDLSSDFDGNSPAAAPHQRTAVPVDGGAEREQGRLPRALMRLEAPRGSPEYLASGFGTRIMATHPRDQPGADSPRHLVPESVFPVLDVRSRGIILGPQPKAHQADNIYVPVGKVLFALAAGAFEMLCPPPLDERQQTPYPPEWCWAELPKPPFERQHVTSYAVHPDGRTILFSTERGAAAAAATFAFDTALCSGWTPVGEWAPPFAGRAYFDCGLDAFVGLSKDPDAMGHVCSCDAPTTGAGDGLCPAAPAWKRGKERLFSEDPAERHVGATLVYMGRRGEFCLVQCLAIEDDRVEQEELEEEDGAAAGPRRHVLRLTTFSLRYDKNGDLTTGKSRRIRYYKAPSASTDAVLENPVALWL